jgi:hypothetical protein
MVCLWAKGREIWQRVPTDGENCGLTTKPLALVRIKRQRFDQHHRHKWSPQFGQEYCLYI